VGPGAGCVLSGVGNNVAVGVGGNSGVELLSGNGKTVQLANNIENIIKPIEYDFIAILNLMD
jgi:hypothetical protein